MKIRSTLSKAQAGFRESFRKILVSLKRKPHTIPLLVLAAAFIFYSFNLTHISDTTAKIQLGGMGLTGFCTMLFSLLSFVCFLNAYPHRKKTNIPMLVLVFLMLGLLIFCDFFYASRILQAANRPDHPISMTEFAYIGNAYRVLMVHWIIVAVGAVLTAMVPLLRKWLRKINTSLQVEEGSQMQDLLLRDEA